MNPRLSAIPAELLATDGNNADRLWRAGRLTRWLDVRGIRGVTAYDLDAERRRRADRKDAPA